MNFRNPSGTFLLCGVSETEHFGQSMAPMLTAGSVVCLQGELGTGKSVLSRAIAGALGVTDRMPSPTYTLVEEYIGRLPVLHIDLYRLGDEEEFDMLGITEQMDRSVSLVEWADRAPALFARADMAIRLSIDATNPEFRLCTVESSLP